MIAFTYNLNVVFLSHIGDKTSRKIIITKVKIGFTSKKDEQGCY